jgi:hypothetical protein
MPGRKFIAITVAVLVSSLIITAYQVMATRPAWRINRANFLRIEKGMTVEEVSAILGGSPGDYNVFRQPYHCGWSVRPADRVPNRRVSYPSERWCGDAGTILIKLDDGKVAWRLFMKDSDGESLFPDEEEFLHGK